MEDPSNSEQPSWMLKAQDDAMKPWRRNTGTDS